MRFVIIDGPSSVKPLVGQNWLNTFFKDTVYPGTEASDKHAQYYQKVTAADITRLQIRTSYSTGNLKVYNEANTLIKLIGASATVGFVEQADSRGGNFAEGATGKTQIFFSGEMPDFFEVGAEIAVSGNASFNGSYVVEDIKPGTGAAAGKEVLIISKVWPGGAAVQTATVDTTYDLEPFDVHQYVIDWNAVDLPVGKYYLLFTYDHSGFTTVRAKSEPIEKLASAADTLTIDYKCNEVGFLIDYDNDTLGSFLNRIRVDGYLAWPTPGGERESMVDSKNKPVVLRENVTMLTEFNAEDLPYYLLQLLALVFAHDQILIDGTEYAKAEKDVSAEYFDYDRLGNFVVKLQLADYESENSHDNSNDSATVDVLEVGGTILRLS